MKIIDFDNHTDLSVNLDKLEEIAQFLTSRELELVITDNKTITKMNYKHRAKNTPTDVLSFPLEIPAMPNELSHIPLGSIVISAEYVHLKAIEFGHTQQDELSLLFIHGMLHLLGFDHETDQGEMRLKEKELIEQFELPLSLIIRTGEY